MKKFSGFAALLIAFSIAFLPAARASVTTNEADSVVNVYYACEINGVVCGYSEEKDILTEKEGRKVIEQEMRIFIMLSLLGSEYNVDIKTRAQVDPVTGKCSSIKMDMMQGSTRYTVDLRVEGNKAFIKSPRSADTLEVEISPDIVIGSDETFRRLKKDIVENNSAEVSYDILEVMEGEIQKSTFKKLREEKLELAERTFQTVVIEQMNSKTGLKTTYWLAPGEDYFVKFEVLNRKIYLSDPNVVDKIKVADMDPSIFTKTNLSVSDITSINYLKVNAVIEPSGAALTPEDLNVPGQKFTGTVVNNRIEGIFEISHRKYDGKNAPPFPPRYKDPLLSKYLAPGEMVESGDMVLSAKAKEITDGSADSWEAAVRLSRWVAENIHYAIPGGVTARKTYDMRAGECGAHSFLLASFCRSVGIPARVVWGGIYVPNYGGGFGQHGWNEIYMGDAGWIPVDATAVEPDFVDAGHIRISEYESVASTFNGRKFEVLDHRLKDVPEISAAKFSEYTGKYTSLESNRTFEVLIKEGNLAVNIPGKMILPFNEPDQKGRWNCKLSPYLYLVFGKNEEGKTDNFLLHEIIIMTRKSPAAETANVPEDLKPYMGDYLFAANNSDFTVFYLDGSLAVADHRAKDTTRLNRPDAEGGWRDEFDKGTFYFDKDAAGNITAFRVDIGTKFTRGELAAGIIEQVISDKGIEAGIAKFGELKSAPGIIFTESSINQLGYKFLNEGKNTEAVEIFRLNAEAYPESFNVYDSLGEAYMKSGNNELAARNYEHSLELNPNNENARKMLEKIKAQK